MVRQMLVYYIDLYEFLENPEKYWLEVNKDTQNHLQNQHFLILFGKREDSLLQNKNKMPLFKDILIGFCPIFYFYRTAIISKLKLLPQTGTDYNCNTKKGRIKICIE